MPAVLDGLHLGVWWKSLPELLFRAVEGDPIVLQKNCAESVLLFSGRAEKQIPERFLFVQSDFDPPEIILEDPLFLSEKLAGYPIFCFTHIHACKTGGHPFLLSV